jgi:hypothetical protein
VPEPDQPADASIAADDAHTLGRWLARGSAMAAFVCFTLNCVLKQLLFKDGVPGGSVWNQVVGNLSMLVVLGGVVLGILGLIAGIRRGSRDTAGVAIIGLVLNLGIVFVTLWALYLLGKLG